MVRGVVCSATDFIGDDADGTHYDDGSQDVANLAIDLKEVERAQKTK